MNEPKIPHYSPIVQEVNAGTYWWCACGASKTQPFCDGAHKGSGYKSLKFEVAEPRTIAWCACKHTKNPPFCDGSHGKL
jgi:CDGSH-type Zn-finger protein